MSVAPLLSELRRRDVRLWIDGGQLRCSAAPGTLTAELVERVRQLKGDIVDFLRSAQALAAQERAIVPLQQNGSHVPVFGVPGHNGDVFCYRALAQALGDNQPFFGLQPPGVDGQAAPLESVEEIAAYYAAQIRRFRPGAPCVIAGFCAGGAVAFELAQQLARSGAPVSLLALFGCQFPAFFRLPGQLRWRVARKMERIGNHARALAAGTWNERRRYIAAKLRRRETADTAPADPVLALRAKVERATVLAVRRYRPEPFDGRVALFLPSKRWARSAFAALDWRLVATTEEHVGPDGCDGDNMLREPNAQAFAALFRRCQAAPPEKPAAK